MFAGGAFDVVAAAARYSGRVDSGAVSGEDPSIVSRDRDARVARVDSYKKSRCGKS